MKSTFTQYIYVLSAFVVLTQHARAVDVIYQKSSDQAVSGTITDVTATSITIERGSKKTDIPVNDIDRLRWNAEPARINLARADEKNGRLDEALEKYKEALGEATDRNLKSDIEFMIARVTATRALADPEKLDDAIKELNSYQAQNKSFYRYYDALYLLGRLQMAKKDFVSAQTTFQQLAATPWNDYKMASQNALARIKLMQNDVAAALAGYEAVLKMPAQTNAEKTKRYEALLGKANCLQKEDKNAEAVQALQDVIDNLPGSDSAVLAEAYLLQGSGLRKQKKNKEAVLAYLHVDVLFASESAMHAEALYWLSQLWGQVGHQGRATAASTKLKSSYPNSEWAKK